MDLQPREINKIDGKIIEFIDKNKNILFLLAISFLALSIRVIFIDFESNDFKSFLLKWCEYIEQNGEFKALSSIDSDYNNLYLYILTVCTYLPGSYLLNIKLVSIIFDFLTAGVCFLLASHINRNEENNNTAYIIYGIVLFLPTVIMNGSVWGQCDIIYSFFAIASIYCMLTKRYKTGFILYGISFAFKIQSIFILPIYLILYIKKKEFSILNFLLIPLVNILINLPLAFGELGVNAFFRAYLMQMTEYSAMVINYPNIYNLINTESSIVAKAGIIFTIALLGIITFIVISNDKKIEDIEVIGVSALIILCAVYFLPHMHERYSFLGEILLIMYYILRRKKSYLPIVLILLICNLYVRYLFGEYYFDMRISSILMIFLIVIFSIDLAKEYLNLKEFAV